MDVYSEVDHGNHSASEGFERSSHSARFGLSRVNLVCNSAVIPAISRTRVRVAFPHALSNFPYRARPLCANLDGSIHVIRRSL